MNYSANYNNIKSEQVCRTCLIDEGHFFNISDTFDHYTLTQMIQNITNLQMHLKDGYTQFICEQCVQKLREAHTFRNQCLESYNTLTTLVSVSVCEAEFPIIEDVQNKKHMDECHNSIDFNLKKEEDIDSNCDDVDDPDFIYDEDKVKDSCKISQKKNSTIPVSKKSSKERKQSIIFHCPLCHEIFYSKSTFYNIHIKTFHPDRVDDDCFTLPLKPIGHLLTRKRKIRYQCSLDTFYGQSFAAFKRHMKKHTGENPIVCVDCGFRTINILKLKRHRREKHIEKKKYSCTLCDYTSHNRERFKTHLLSHLSEYNHHKCDLCTLTFRQESKMTKHKKKIHEELEPYICAICHKIFSDSTCLVDHWKDHNIIKKAQINICHYCGKKCSNEACVKSHINKYHEPIFFKCDLCGFITKDKHSLKLHIMAHNDDKPFKCSECTYSSTRKRNLQEHTLRRHTKEKAYACDLCHYKTAMAYDMKSHKSVHTGERPYSCPFCCYSGRKTWNLRKHLQSQHRTEKNI